MSESDTNSSGNEFSDVEFDVNNPQEFYDDWLSGVPMTLRKTFAAMIMDLCVSQKKMKVREAAAEAEFFTGFNESHHIVECARDCAKIAPIFFHAEIWYANLACSRKRLRHYYSRVVFPRPIFPQFSIFTIK